MPVQLPGLPARAGAAPAGPGPLPRARAAAAERRRAGPPGGRRADQDVPALRRAPVPPLPQPALPAALHRDPPRARGLASPRRRGRRGRRGRRAAGGGRRAAGGPGYRVVERGKVPGGSAGGNGLAEVAGNWPVLNGGTASWVCVGSSPGNGRGLGEKWLTGSAIVDSGDSVEGKSSKSTSSASTASLAASIENRPMTIAPAKMIRIPTPVKKPISSR